MAVQIPEDTKFRRARFRPARRRSIWNLRGVRVLRATIPFAAILYFVYYAMALIIQAPDLRIDRIVVQGNGHLSAMQVQSLVSGLRGKSILSADLVAGHQELVESPWIENVTLRRILPSTIEIMVSERSPVGVGRLGGQLYLIDERGTVIDKYDVQFADLDLPIIDGLSFAFRGGKQVVDESRADLIERLIAEVSVRSDLAQRISQIDVQNADDAVVMLTGDPAAIHLGKQQFLRRLESYIELAPVLYAHTPKIDYVDLRFDSHVYVQPAPLGVEAEIEGLVPLALLGEDLDR